MQRHVGNISWIMYEQCAINPQRPDVEACSNIHAWRANMEYLITAFGEGIAETIPDSRQGMGPGWKGSTQTLMTRYGQITR